MSLVITDEDGLRLLRFGTRWCQGMMRIADPDRLELEYAVRMCAWLLFHDLDSLADRHLVTLGLGAGSLTRFAHRVLGMRTSAVDIDGDVIQACRTHFQLPPDGDRLQVVQADAEEFMARPAQQGRFDVIQVDAFDAAVDRHALDGEAFYADCRGALRAGGTVAINLMGRRLDTRAGVERIRAGLRPRGVWQFPPTEAGNVIVIAHSTEAPAEDVLTARAREIERRWDLPAPAWLAMARRS